MKVYHFHNGSGGGVFSVIRNLLLYNQHSEIENHIVYTINKKQRKNFKIPEVKGAVSEQVFYYSPTWNFYYTCKQLSKLLPDDKAVVVAHDWLELGMMSNLGLQNPVVHFLHGAYSYYFQLALHHEAAIDKFICVARDIENKLIELLPKRKKDIWYLRFPVPEIRTKKSDPVNCNIIFIGRLTKNKGYHLLPRIAEKLKEKNIDVTWNIVESTTTDTRQEVIWNKDVKVVFYKDISNADVLGLLAEMQIYLLPSLAEGTPLTLVEAMKAGVVPLVNNINGGIQELVVNNHTGYKINENNIEDYIEKIIELIDNNTLAIQMRKNCIEKANALFDPYRNTAIIENVLVNAFESKRENKIAKKIYGSRLDQPWLSNTVTRSVRGLK